MYHTTQYHGSRTTANNII